MAVYNLKIAGQDREHPFGDPDDKAAWDEYHVPWIRPRRCFRCNLPLVTAEHVIEWQGEVEEFTIHLHPDCAQYMVNRIIADIVSIDRCMATNGENYEALPDS